MAKVQVLGQRCLHKPKMLIRGVFTQKKKLWEAMEELYKQPLMIRDDFTKKLVPCNYNGLCKILREVGRVTLVAEDGDTIFQIVDAETNKLRDWDIDEDGEPRCNPVTK
jgi:hypothetical protein